MANLRLSGGEWHVATVGREACSIAGGGMVIANTYHVLGGEDNARVMAAGKELLAACEALLYEFPDLDEILTDGNRPERCRRVLGLARAAVAKAKGA